MFIRIKKVKKGSGKIYEFAQLVVGMWRQKRIVRLHENKWKFRRFNNSLHKYKGFLGRVYRFEEAKKIEEQGRISRKNFEDFVVNKNIEEIYKYLVENELVNRGFSYKGKVLVNRGVFVDLERLIVHDGKGDVVIKLGEVGGYLCSLTLRELFNIKKIDGRVEGMYLMKKLRMAGIKLSSEQFFVLVDKLLKEGEMNKQLGSFHKLAQN